MLTALKFADQALALFRTGTALSHERNLMRSKSSSVQRQIMQANMPRHTAKKRTLKKNVGIEHAATTAATPETKVIHNLGAKRSRNKKNRIAVSRLRLAVQASAAPSIPRVRMAQ